MILITGGAGFIGLNFVEYLQKIGEPFTVLDSLTYASNENELKRTGADYTVLDISDRIGVSNFFQTHQIDTIFHFAAETHVDNSIISCYPFIQSNIIGTVNLLEESYKRNIHFFHISTDEVFGSIPTGQFNENSAYDPRNPYSASKASAEHFVKAYHNTYNLQYNIINSSNNYGRYQHQEKLIPKTIHNLSNNLPVPVYGNGKQIRDWIHATDTCDAIYTIYTRGKKNERYCIGSNQELENIQIIKKICDIMNKSYDSIEYVTDRQGHDIRYATSIEKIQNELGWRPKVDIETGLRELIYNR
jgi:dTDP-glucose 4,6-dehydratase